MIVQKGLNSLNSLTSLNTKQTVLPKSKATTRLGLAFGPQAGIRATHLQIVLERPFWNVQQFKNLKSYVQRNEWVCVPIHLKSPSSWALSHSEKIHGFKRSTLSTNLRFGWLMEDPALGALQAFAKPDASSAKCFQAALQQERILCFTHRWL